MNIIEFARMGGSVKSDKKSTSCKENGKLGGRPIKPLNIGLPESEFLKVLSGEKRQFNTCKNGRKDKYFYAKRPANVNISSLDGDRQFQKSVLKTIIQIEETATEWVIRI